MLLTYYVSSVKDGHDNFWYEGQRGRIHGLAVEASSNAPCFWLSEQENVGYERMPRTPGVAHLFHKIVQRGMSSNRGSIGCLACVARFFSGLNHTTVHQVVPFILRKLRFGWCLELIE